MTMPFPKTGSLIEIVQAFTDNPNHMAAPMFPAGKTNSDSYEFDLVSNSRGVTTYRHPDGEAGTLAVRPKTRYKVILPSMREKKFLRESTLRWEDTPGQRDGRKNFMKSITEELADLDGFFQRTNEFARWKLLTSGQYLATYEGGSSYLYDFGIGSAATASAEWDAPASSDPVQNLLAWKTLVRQACGIMPTDCYMGSSALNFAMQAPTTQSYLDDQTKNEYATTGTVKRLADMNIHINDDGYVDASGNFKYYLSTDGVATDMCVIKTPGAVGKTVSGPCVDSDAPAGLIGKFAKSREMFDPSGREILMAETVMPGLTNPNRVGAFTLWT